MREEIKQLLETHRVDLAEMDSELEFKQEVLKRAKSEKGKVVSMINQYNVMVLNKLIDEREELTDYINRMIDTILEYDLSQEEIFDLRLKESEKAKFSFDVLVDVKDHQLERPVEIHHNQDYIKVQRELTQRYCMAEHNRTPYLNAVTVRSDHIQGVHNDLEFTREFTPAPMIMADLSIKRAVEYLVNYLKDGKYKIQISGTAYMLS